MTEITIPDIPQGLYVVGVSGGVDSVVLLHLLATPTSNVQRPTSEFIVAHVDHGIRPESARDGELVENLARKYGLPFEMHRAGLGSGTSEDTARRARYGFLRDLQQKHNAKAIILAHHQDDVLETMIINLIRGTGWRGLCSLRSHDGLLRPLLGFPRAEILDYAIRNNLDWLEDESNYDPRYLRNEVRMSLIPKLSVSRRKKLLSLYESQVSLQQKIDSETERLIDGWSVTEDKRIRLQRYPLVMIDTPAALELIQACVRKNTGQILEHKQAWSCLLFAKTAIPGRIHIPRQGVRITSGPHEIIVGNP